MHLPQHRGRRPPAPPPAPTLTTLVIVWKKLQHVDLSRKLFTKTKTKSHDNHWHAQQQKARLLFVIIRPKEYYYILTITIIPVSTYQVRTQRTFAGTLNCAPCPPSRLHSKLIGSDELNTFIVNASDCVAPRVVRKRRDELDAGGLAERTRVYLFFGD